MKRILGLLLGLILVFAVGSVALAVPSVSSPDGFFITAEYDGWSPGFMAGAGYGFDNGLALGGMYYPDWGNFGVFCSYDLEQFFFLGEVYLDPSGPVGRLHALYKFGGEILTAGVGVGIDFWTFPTEIGASIEAAAELSLTENIQIYGQVSYRPEGGYFAGKLGAVIEF